MKRAALYARVSTDKQTQQATIESQLAELMKQIARAGQVLVKEYIDDGYRGALLDRPALEELRRRKSSSARRAAGGTASAPAASSARETAPSAMTTCRRRRPPIAPSS
jgi:hypothetical protein